MLYLYIIEFYSATKKNEILSFLGKWMELENIQWFSQIEKAKSHIFSHMWNLVLKPM
jgi:ABC-type dipeptide/oligopeptide/nickel transport system permease subunit